LDHQSNITSPKPLPHLLEARDGLPGTPGKSQKLTDPLYQAGLERMD